MTTLVSGDAARAVGLAKIKREKSVIAKSVNGSFIGQCSYKYKEPILLPEISSAGHGRPACWDAIAFAE
jgi:hypothetical protein